MEKIVDIRRSLWYNIRDPHSNYVWANNRLTAALLLTCSPEDVDVCINPGSIPANRIANA